MHMDLSATRIAVIANKCKEAKYEYNQKKLNEKLNVQNNNNILNIMEIYDIFQPILKEKYIIKIILNMKFDIEVADFR